jgi:hypothetical protein
VPARPGCRSAQDLRASDFDFRSGFHCLGFCCRSRAPYHESRSEIFVSRFRAAALCLGGLAGAFVESASPRFSLAGAGSLGVRPPSVGSSVSRTEPLPISVFFCERAATKLLRGPFYFSLGTGDRCFCCKLSVLIFVLLSRFRVLSGGLLLTAPARGLVLRFWIFASSIDVYQAN